ncbi:hypothetical protein FOA52_011631 [Chlamydomonas sp. UWO 241]|nr:hypothetical protein FOA52_011631 [Chlamydomonas sp. UWO 241]
MDAQGTKPRAGHSQADLVAAAVAFAAPSGGIIDIGINLVDRSFEKDRAAVIERAAAAGVRAMVVTGTCTRAAPLLTWQTPRPRTHSISRPACTRTTQSPPKGCDADTLSALTRLAAHPKCVAIGECGLDFNRNFSPPDVQIEWFEKQVALVKTLQKPLFMHCRDAADDFARILSAHAPLGVPAVVHCFTGSKDELERFLALGLYIGITGWICDDRPERGGAELASLLPSIPSDKLMIETDGPYLVPRSIKPSRARPGRNEPALLPHVLRAVAHATGKSEEQVARETSDVVRAVFGLPL